MLVEVAALTADQCLVFIMLSRQCLCSVWIKNIYFSPQVSEGLVLRDGSRLKYPINGIVGFCFNINQ